MTAYSLLMSHNSDMSRYNDGKAASQRHCYYELQVQSNIDIVDSWLLISFASTLQLLLDIVDFTRYGAARNSHYIEHRLYREQLPASFE